MYIPAITQSTYAFTPATNSFRPAKYKFLRGQVGRRPDRTKDPVTNVSREKTSE